ncbi:MAG: DNA/RNA nuclease SfsA [Candidatus Thorarchaeota archaeon]|nr:DNA/RNA nuclease SfsA [Candidatus Thorarchaeota archaeon]
MTKTAGIRKAVLIDRPNRFLGRVRLDGQVTEAFIPNPGRMLELMIPGNEVFLRENKASHRKTDYDMIGLEYNGVLVSIDSNLPNRFIKRLLRSYELPFFKDYDSVIPEPRAFEGRFDFKLTSTKGASFIEVKSCTLVEEGRAIFPDSPTTRGARHLRHLAAALKENQVKRSAIIFVIQRPDAKVFSPNDNTDPKFGDALRFAHANGVEVFPLVTQVVDWDLKLVRQIPYELEHFISKP